MSSSPPATQSQRPRLSPTPRTNEALFSLPPLKSSSVFAAPSSQKRMSVPERQQPIPWPVPVYQEFSGPCTNFIFSQPGAYQITMGQGPPAYQQEQP